MYTECLWRHHEVLDCALGGDDAFAQTDGPARELAGACGAAHLDQVVPDARNGRGHLGARVEGLLQCNFYLSQIRFM